MSYVYIQSENHRECPPHGLFTVGYYNPAGEWVGESDHGGEDGIAQAAYRCHILNGGSMTFEQFDREFIR